MTTQDLLATFTDTSGEEVNRTLVSMGVLGVADLADDSPELQILLSSITEIFSTSLPELTGELDQDLMRVSRDINLSRLFRNRGIMLLYQVLKQQVDGVPIYQFFNNPYTDSPFRNRTEFIDWFSRDAHISRDLIFRNISAIDRALQIGVSLENAYGYLNKYAHAFRETLKNTLQWDDDTKQLAGVDPDIAINISNKVDGDEPERNTLIKELAQRVKEGDDDAEIDLLHEIKHSVIKLLDEVTNQDSAKGAMRFVKHDILTKPEISYKWNSDCQCIEVTLISRAIADTGEEFVDDLISVDLLLDAPDVPEEILTDLLTRLPITNRATVDI